MRELTQTEIEIVSGGGVKTTDGKCVVAKGESLVAGVLTYIAVGLRNIWGSGGGGTPDPWG
jgi:hypothetical protein